MTRGEEGETVEGERGVERGGGTGPANEEVVNDLSETRLQRSAGLAVTGTYLVDPVRVQHTETSALAAHTLLCDVTQVTCWLQLGDTLAGWLTVHNTLRDIMKTRG